MASLSVSAFDAMMKEQYPTLRIEALAVKKRPLLEWMPKRDAFYGDAYIVPVLYEDPQSRSAVLANAITNTETSKQEKFVLSARCKDYGVVTIDGEAIMAASKDVGSFIRAKDTQIKGMLRNLGKSLHLALYRSGSGSLGQLSNAVDGSGECVLTFANKSDVHNFGVGQTLQANDTDNSTSMRAGTPQVTERSVSAGTVTVDETAVATHSWGTTDYIFNHGDADAKCTGLAGWLPLSEPTATAFFTVDRTKDATRLGGQRVDNSGRSILENAEELAMLIGEEGGEPDALFMNPRAGLILAEQTGAKVSRGEGGKAHLSWSGFVIENFVTGPIECRFDIGCPPNRGYALQKDTWHFAHMGGVPHIIRDDGRDSLRGATTDDIQLRARYFGELACNCPGYNGVMSVATA
jgi:hypothetical protein